MNAPRLYVDDLADHLTQGHEVALSREHAKHVKALRMNDGQQLVLFSGRGGHYQACLRWKDKSLPVAEISVFCRSISERHTQQTLAFSLCTPTKMALIIQKATELGASHLVPLITQRATHGVSSLSESKIQRYFRIIASACEQCGVDTLPIFRSAMTLEDAVRMHKSHTCFMLDPLASVRLNASLCEHAEHIVWFVGPEGGWTEQEKACADAEGIATVAMGQYVLRMETACMATLVCGMALSNAL